MSETGRIRVTIDAVPLVVQPDAARVASFGAPGRGEFVTPLPSTNNDRAAGARRFEVVVHGWLFEAVTEPAARAELRDRATKAAAEHHLSAQVTLRAQIPGRVVRLWVAVGESVERGQRLLAIEAMKMENEIRAPQSGTVNHVAVAVGDRIERHDPLVTLD